MGLIDFCTPPSEVRSQISRVRQRMLEVEARNPKVYDALKHLLAELDDWMIAIEKRLDGLEQK